MSFNLFELSTIWTM